MAKYIDKINIDKYDPLASKIGNTMDTEAGRFETKKSLIFNKTFFNNKNLLAAQRIEINQIEPQLNR